MEIPTFDELLKLSPEEITKLRKEKTQEFINSLPKNQQSRYKAMQWNIDKRLELAPNPTKGLIDLSKKMWESFLCLNEELKALKVENEKI